ncbi:MAG TPA: BlaI/MecI/CopY family transcriptional regulator [Longimicrobium sp.]|jgi:predicted transcriptional regulator
MSSDTPPDAELSRRERQIMDVIFRLGRASAAEVHELLPDAPSATAVRTLLRILEDKGHLRHEKDGPRHIYLPTVPRDSAQRSAAAHLLRTFFGGSPRAAVAALLDLSERPLTPGEREELVEMIRREREEGR